MTITKRIKIALALVAKTQPAYRHALRNYKTMPQGQAAAALARYNRALGELVAARGLIDTRESELIAIADRSADPVAAWQRVRDHRAAFYNHVPSHAVLDMRVAYGSR